VMSEDRNLTYFDHWAAARGEFVKHFDECAAELGLEHHWEERRWAIESFEESEQIKILHTGEIKLKWEHMCWWADCKHPVLHNTYYCVVAGTDNVVWEKPYDRAKRLEDAR